MYFVHAGAIRLINDGISIEYAAAFFLLADKLRDAVNVILKNLKDFHLAIAVCRVYEGKYKRDRKYKYLTSALQVTIVTY